MKPTCFCIILPVLTCLVLPTSAFKTADHCFPRQFGGRLAVSDLQTVAAMNSHRSSLLASAVQDVQGSVSFSVDFDAGLMVAQPTSTAGHGHQLSIVADFENSVVAGRQSVSWEFYLVDSITKECWILDGLVDRRRRFVDRCPLRHAFYHGYIRHLGDDGQCSDDERDDGLLFSVRSSKSDDDDESSEAEPLAVVSAETGLPQVLVCQAGASCRWKSLIFLDVAESLERRTGALVTDVTSTCRAVRRIKALDELHDSLHKAAFALVILRQFFSQQIPPEEPTPCCAPPQWQATVSKTSQYKYSYSGKIGVETVDLPHLYVDYNAGYLAGTLLESVNGQLQDNLTFLITLNYTSNAGVMMYVVDNSLSACSVLTIYGFTPRTASCVPENAEYEETVRVGPATLDVWVAEYQAESFNGTASRYVSAETCFPVLQSYVWTSPGEVVRGYAVATDVRPLPSAAASLFTVPTQCNDAAVELSLDANDLGSGLQTALSYFA